MNLIHHAYTEAEPGRSAFKRPEDYQRFEGLLADGRKLFRIKLYAYCLMPVHWHLVVQGRGRDDVSAFLRWLTFRSGRAWRGPMHAQQWATRAVDRNVGFYRLCRRIERMPVDAQITDHAEYWRWGSLWVRNFAPDGYRTILLDPWPDGTPKDWTEGVNEPKTIDTPALLGNPVGAWGRGETGRRADLGNRTEVR